MQAKRTFYLHIGLPKTATTYLQTVVFPALDHLTYIDRLIPSKIEPHPFQVALAYFKNPSVEDPRRLAKLCAMLDQLEDSTSKDIFLACENYSVGRMAFWTEGAPSPEIFAQKLQRLMDARPHLTIKIIFGIRQPDQWFASRYAQSGRGLEVADQADFDARIEKFCGGELTGAQRWIIKGEAEAQIRAVIGAENLFTFQMEDLFADLKTGLEELATFLSHRDAGGFVEHLSQSDAFSKKKNDKATDKNQWKILGKPGHIHLSSDQAQAICRKTGWS